MKSKFFFLTISLFFFSLSLFSANGDNLSTGKEKCVSPDVMEIKANENSSLIIRVLKSGSRVYRYHIRVVADDGTDYNTLQYLSGGIVNTKVDFKSYNPVRATVFLEAAHGPTDEIWAPIKIKQVMYTNSGIYGNGTTSVKIELGQFIWGTPVIEVEID